MESTFAASLMYMMHKQRDAVSLIPFNSGIEFFNPPKSTYAHLRQNYTYLEGILRDENNANKQYKTASAPAIHDCKKIKSP